MKLLFIVTGLGMGGAERQVCDLADTFAKAGHDVMLISMTGDIVNRPKDESIKIVNLSMSKSLAGFVKAYSKARNLIYEFKPNIVHSHMIHANIFARLLRINTKIPRLICTAHSTNEGGGMRMWAYRLTDSLCDLTTNVSQEAVDKFISQGAVKPERIIAVHNGIDTSHFCFKPDKRDELRQTLAVKNDAPLILAVGRLTEAKDYPNLFNAFSCLLEKYQDANLAIIGIGDQENELKKLAEKLNIITQLHFLGLRRDICDWMSTADIYVMSSAWEGMPLVLLEAMACELVIVATDCGGVREVVGDTGFLVPPNDSAKLASAMTDALELSLEDRTQFEHLARKRVEENYSLSSVCERWLKIYSGNDSLSS